jgi:gamma-glutamyltranspeptidase
MAVLTMIGAGGFALFLTTSGYTFLSGREKNPAEQPSDLP